MPEASFPKQDPKYSGLKWSLYDFGNSAYALNVVTLFFPLYFSAFVSPSSSAWATVAAVSILSSAILAPIAGHLADRYSARREALLIAASLAVLSTVALGVATSSGAIVTFFVLSSTFFYISTAFYDAILVTLPRDSRTAVSGLGWAIGYVGGLICLGLVYLMLGLSMPATQGDYLKVFLTTGLFFMLSSVAFFRTLPGGQDRGAASLQIRGQILRSLKPKTTRTLLFLLFGSFLVMNGVTTIVYFTAIFASETLHFSIGQIAALLSLTQGVAIPSTILACKVAERSSGEIRYLIFANCVWMAICLSMSFFRSPGWYVVIAIFTGLVIGTTPALLRSCLAKVTPPGTRGAIFGFGLLGTRAASVIGPLTFGVVASRYGAPVGMLSVIPFFLAGSVLLIMASRGFRSVEENVRH